MKISKPKLNLLILTDDCMDKRKAICPLKIFNVGGIKLTEHKNVFFISGPDLKLGEGN